MNVRSQSRAKGVRTAAPEVRFLFNGDFVDRGTWGPEAGAAGARLVGRANDEGNQQEQRDHLQGMVIDIIDVVIDDG